MVFFVLEHNNKGQCISFLYNMHNWLFVWKRRVRQGMIPTGVRHASGNAEGRALDSKGNFF